MGLSKDGLKKDPAPSFTKYGAKRKCHDCGKPTYNYRCTACHEKFRLKHGVPVEDDDEGPGDSWLSVPGHKSGRRYDDY